MENQNLDNQPNQIRRNPTRFNTNVNQGKANEKTVDAQTGQNRNDEINPAKLDNDEIDLDRSGINTSPGDEDASFGSGETTDQADGQTGESGGGVSYGSNPRETESETSHKGQVGGQHASSPGQGQTYGQKDREKIPKVDQEGRIEDQNAMNRGMDQNKNGNQQGSQFNQ